MKVLRDPEGKLSGSDTRTCFWLAAPSEAPQHFYTVSHQHIQVNRSVFFSVGEGECMCAFICLLID